MKTSNCVNVIKLIIIIIITICSFLNYLIDDVSQQAFFWLETFLGTSQIITTK